MTFLLGHVGEGAQPQAEGNLQTIEGHERVGPGQGRLHQMLEELDRLKQLNQQIASGVQVSTGHNDHKANVHICESTGEAEKDLCEAKAVLQQASLDTARADKSLAEATRNLQSTLLVESKTKLLTDKATALAFDPRLEGLYLAGVGVRRKTIIRSTMSQCIVLRQP